MFPKAGTSAACWGEGMRQRSKPDLGCRELVSFRHAFLNEQGQSLIGTFLGVQSEVEGLLGLLQ